MFAISTCIRIQIKYIFNLKAQTVNQKTRSNRNYSLKFEENEFFLKTLQVL